jgi:hypothetical protein
MIRLSRGGVSRRQITCANIGYSLLCTIVYLYSKKMSKMNMLGRGHIYRVWAGAFLGLSVGEWKGPDGRRARSNTLKVGKNVFVDNA